MVVPALHRRADCWIGFNPLTCARGLADRAAGAVRQCVYWCIDFTEHRFGDGLLTRAYEEVEGICCRHSDARIDVSDVAAVARTQRHGRARMAPVRVVAIGAWLDGVPTTTPDSWRRRTLTYLGYLIRAQGGDMFLDALEQLQRREVDFRADVIGRGPMQAELEAKASRLGLDGRVAFHGYVEDPEMTRLLADGSIGVALYDPAVATFTRWADPGKLKSYLAAGLPILLTDVPPNAHQLEQSGAAEIVPFDAAAIADAMQRQLSSPEDWQRRRAAALELRRDSDWNVLLEDAMRWLGYAC
jgi:glycosyltransferase involved in cell wall biosynthesis